MESIHIFMKAVGLTDDAVYMLYTVNWIAVLKEINLDNTDQKYNFLKQIQGLAEQKCRITSAYACYEPVIHTLYRP